MESGENSLVILTRATQMLAEVKTIQQAKDLKSLALTAADWARRKGMSEEAIQHARSIALEAERKMGEMLKASELNKGTRGQLKGKEFSGGAVVLPPENVTPTLAELGITKRESAEAQKLAEMPEEVFQEIKEGKTGRADAKRKIKKEEVNKKTSALPSEKFSVIYADPPWSYNDKQSGSISDNYGGAEKHYPSMSLPDLKALSIPELAAPDAVLFLWATCPLLEDALDLCRAWGFKYKAQFVWDKVKHNMGHYNSVRHELLLICTRGSMTPENVKLFDSVQSIERTEKHSQKPEEFRKIIETLYPTGKKIELFARGKADGWNTWGNEA